MSRRDWNESGRPGLLPEVPGVMSGEFFGIPGRGGTRRSSFINIPAAPPDERNHPSSVQRIPGQIKSVSKHADTSFIDL